MFLIDLFSPFASSCTLLMASKDLLRLLLQFYSSPLFCTCKSTWACGLVSLQDLFVRYLPPQTFLVVIVLSCVRRDYGPCLDCFSHYTVLLLACLVFSASFLIFSISMRFWWRFILPFAFSAPIVIAVYVVFYLCRLMLWNWNYNCRQSNRQFFLLPN